MTTVLYIVLIAAALRLAYYGGTTAAHGRRWRITTRATQKGVIVYVQRGRKRLEQGRVRFNRRKSENPDEDFGERISIVRARARSRRDELNVHERRVREINRRWRR